MSQVLLNDEESIETHVQLRMKEIQSKVDALDKAWRVTKQAADDMLKAVPIYIGLRSFWPTCWADMNNKRHVKDTLSTHLIEMDHKIKTKLRLEAMDGLLTEKQKAIAEKHGLTSEELKVLREGVHQ